MRSPSGGVRVEAHDHFRKSPGPRVWLPTRPHHEPLLDTGADRVQGLGAAPRLSSRPKATTSYRSRRRAASLPSDRLHQTGRFPGDESHRRRPQAGSEAEPISIRPRRQQPERHPRFEGCVYGGARGRAPHRNSAASGCRVHREIRRSEARDIGHRGTDTRVPKSVPVAEGRWREACVVLHNAGASDGFGRQRRCRGGRGAPASPRYGPSLSPKMGGLESRTRVVPSSAGARADWSTFAHLTDDDGTRCYTG
jgi:hypothetical protein